MYFLNNSHFCPKYPATRLCKKKNPTNTTIYSLVYKLYVHVTNKAKNTCNLVLIKFGFFYISKEIHSNALKNQDLVKSLTRWLVFCNFASKQHGYWHLNEKYF